MIYNLNSNFVRVEKVIQPEQNSNLNCNSSRYSHIPNIKSLYQRTSKKGPDNAKFEQKIQVQGLWYIDLIFGMWLYLDDLQFKFEFRSGRMTFGWVMALELVFFVQIWSCPDFSLKSKYKFKGHNSAKYHSTGTKFELKV
jgi:hypothetical protein